MRDNLLYGDGFRGEGRCVFRGGRLQGVIGTAKVDEDYELNMVVNNKAILDGGLQRKDSFEVDCLFEKDCVFFKVNKSNEMNFPYQYLICYKPLSRRDYGFTPT